MEKRLLRQLGLRTWQALPLSLQRFLEPLARKLVGCIGLADTRSHPFGRAAIAAYWTRHNVTLHQGFTSQQSSIDYFHWRCDQYPGYLDLMPVSGMDGKHILDYGCGPGNDLVGFAEYSNATAIVGCDVSSSSIAEAAARMRFHTKVPCEVIALAAEAETLPFSDARFDFIHCSGVLHHVVNLKETLRELRRVLRPDGMMRVMVYHADSVWMHLYVAYVLRLRDGRIARSLPIRDAFARSTDGPACPIARCYLFEEFETEANQVGFLCSLKGVACSVFERKLVQQFLNDAVMDTRLEPEHRKFLLALTFDEQMNPIYQGKKAGIDLVIELTPCDPTSP